jgi:hypothetical protein
VASTTKLVSRARTIARRRRGTSKLSSYGSFNKDDNLKSILDSQVYRAPASGARAR